MSSPSASAIAAAEMPFAWRDDNPVPIALLCRLQVPFWGFDDLPHTGDLVVHVDAADAVSAIFADLYAARFPLEQVRLIDEYRAVDDDSAADNNTSCFCSRPITGSASEWSLHAYGIAIDINPRLNPYQRGSVILPLNGADYLDRVKHSATPGVIVPGDACHVAFTSRGWAWGGDWAATRGYVDYQHFYFGDAASTRCQVW